MLFHLETSWWRPHNFAFCTPLNLSFIKQTRFYLSNFAQVTIPYRDILLSKILKLVLLCRPVMQFCERATIGSNYEQHLTKRSETLVEKWISRQY